MEDLLDAIRRIIMRWTYTQVQLTADAHAGDDTLTVVASKRWRKGDELLIRNADEDVEAGLVIEEVVDEHTLKLVSPLQFGWSVSEDASLIKTIYGQYVKGFFLGEPDVIGMENLPAVTINGTKRSSEWYTIRMTKERYDIEIGVYVADSTQEDGYRFVMRMVDIIQYGLKRNIYPLVSDYKQTSFIANASINDSFLRVADTSQLQCGGMVLFENPHNSEENYISAIHDSTTISVMTPISYDYNVTDSTVIIPSRFIYNSWPADINYGKIHKGTLLKAAVISYFAEETENQLEGGWQDTNLT